MHHELAILLHAHGDLGGVEEYYRDVLRLDATNVLAHYNVANALRAQGKLAESVKYYQGAVKLKPDSAKAHLQLGVTLIVRGDPELSLVHLREAERLKPDEPSILNATAWVLATRPGVSNAMRAEAVRMAERAAELTGRDNAAVLDTLAVAYAPAGRFDEAVQTALRALEQAELGSRSDLTRDIQRHLEYFKAGKPWHLKEQGLDAAPIAQP